MKTTVAIVKLKFDPNKPLNDLTIKLPESTKILAVELKSSEEPFIFITFTALNSIFESDELWREYRVVVCKCNYTVFETDNHKYIGNVNYGDDTFAVFYNNGLISSIV